MPFIIPIFISHEGCPHRCVFCNQERISGHGGDPVSTAEVRATITTWLARRRKSSSADVQVAFYGGSFTGLAPERQRELLRTVAPFIDKGLVQTIRLSTRPDYVDVARVKLLRDHHVSVVELGVQSLDDRVLDISRRGHDAQQTAEAVHLLQDAGMEVGMQLMLGLPGETRKNIIETVSRTVSLRPDVVRIYPVLVIEGSPLAAWFRGGRYRPLTLDGAVIRAAYMKKRFDESGIRVVRMGLQATDGLENALVAGPYHPAFGELVLARLMFTQTRQLLGMLKADRPVHLSISQRDQSVFWGPNRRNMDRLNRLGLLEKFILHLDSSQPRHTLQLCNS